MVLILVSTAAHYSRRWHFFQPCLHHSCPSPRQPRPQLRPAHCPHGMTDPPNRRSSTSCEIPLIVQVRNLCHPKSVLLPSIRMARFGSNSRSIRKLSTAWIVCLRW